MHLGLLLLVSNATGYRLESDVELSERALVATSFRTTSI